MWHALCMLAVSGFLWVMHVRNVGEVSVDWEGLVGDPHVDSRLANLSACDCRAQVPTGYVWAGQGWRK